MTSTLAHSGMYTKDEALEIIEPTEAIEERLFTLNSSTVKFMYDEEGESPPRVIIAGDPLELTKEGYLNACKVIGLGRKYVERTPVDLIMPHLNYWFGNMGGERKALILDRKVFAFMRPGTEVYSTKKLIESMVSSLEEAGYTDIMFDKIHHTINETQISVVLGDVWKDLDNGHRIYGGVQLQNSILGLKPMVLSSYVHQNVYDINGGMISVTTSGQWDRKLGTTAEDIANFMEKDIEFNPDDVYSVYDWINQSTRDVKNRFNHEFKNVANLQQLGTGSHAGVFFNDIFKKYNVPVILRKAIHEEYADRDGSTIYDLWSAIVATTGRHEVRGNPEAARHMMLVAGEIAAHPHSCNGCHRLLDVL